MLKAALNRVTPVVNNYSTTVIEQTVISTGSTSTFSLSDEDTLALDMILGAAENLIVQ